MSPFTPSALAFLLSGMVALAPAAPAVAGQSQVSKPVLLLPEVATLESIRAMLSEIKTLLSAHLSEEGSTNFVLRIIDTTNCLYLHVVDQGIASSLTIGKTVTLSHTRPLQASTDPRKRLEALNALNCRFPLVKFTLRGNQVLTCETTFSMSEGIPPQQIAASYQRFWSDIYEIIHKHSHPYFELLQEPGTNAAPAADAPRRL